MEISVGKIVHNKYEVLKKLGEGATAVVYLVKDLITSQNLAMKIQRPDDPTKSDQVSNQERRFQLEAKALMQFDNKNIVKVFDFFKYMNRQTIVMEYVKGKSLDQIIKEKRTVPSKQTAIYAVQILNALKDIHKKGIYHRDLKPANIMLTYDNQIKLMDFGIVQVSLEQDLTKQGSVIGTVSYLAPEILRQTHKASKQTEIWSVGVILYKMLTGMLPFSGMGNKEIFSEILHKDPISPTLINPDISPELETIVLKMLRKDYYERYSSSESAMDVLMEFINKKNISRSVAELNSTMPTVVSKKVLSMIIGSIILGLLLALIAIILVFTL